MKHIFTLAALIFCVYISYGQELTGNICGKKWFAEKMQNADGAVEKAGKEMKGTYTILNCDGSFESVERSGSILKGTWRYDDASKAVLMTGKDKAAEEVMPVVSCTASSFVVKKKNAAGDYVTVYLGLR